MEFAPDRDLNGDAPVLGAAAFGDLVSTLAGDSSIWKSLDEPPSAKNLRPKKKVKATTTQQLLPPAPPPLPEEDLFEQVTEDPYYGEKPCETCSNVEQLKIALEVAEALNLKKDLTLERKDSTIKQLTEELTALRERVMHYEAKTPQVIGSLPDGQFTESRAPCLAILTFHASAFAIAGAAAHSFGHTLIV